MFSPSPPAAYPFSAGMSLLRATQRPAVPITNNQFSMSNNKWQETDIQP